MVLPAHCTSLSIHKTYEVSPFLFKQTFYQNKNVWGVIYWRELPSMKGQAGWGGSLTPRGLRCGCYVQLIEFLAGSPQRKPGWDPRWKITPAFISSNVLLSRKWFDLFSAGPERKIIPVCGIVSSLDGSIRFDSTEGKKNGGSDWDKRRSANREPLILAAHPTSFVLQMSWGPPFFSFRYVVHTVRGHMTSFHPALTTCIPNISSPPARKGQNNFLRYISFSAQSRPFFSSKGLPSFKPTSSSPDKSHIPCISTLKAAIISPFDTAGNVTKPNIPIVVWEIELGTQKYRLVGTQLIHTHMDYRCEDGHFQVSTINVICFQAMKQGFNSGIRSWRKQLSERARCQKGIGGIYFTKKWRAETLQPGL